MSVVGMLHVSLTVHLIIAVYCDYWGMPLYAYGCLGVAAPLSVLQKLNK